MENLTPRQRELLERLARFDSKVEVRWDEARGVAASIRGTLTEPEKPQTPARTVQQFLVAQGDLFGPPGVVRSLKPLRPPQRDDLGWTRFEFQQYYQGGRGAPIEVYGAQLTAHVTREGILREVQSSCWRDVVVDTRPRVKATALRRRLAAPQAPGYRDLEMSMRRRGERTFPLMQPPRLVIYFWQDRFRLAWTTYSYAPAPADPDAHGSPGLILGQVFVDAVTGEVFLFSPTGMRAESPVVGSGLGVTSDSGGGFVVRQLNVVRVDATSTHRLRDTTHVRDIVTYDLACALAWKDVTSMAGAVSGAQPPLPVSENTTGSDWSRVPTTGSGPVLRMDSQQPEVDAHFFVQRVYEWYFALSGGRAGWDADGAYPTSTVPAALPIRVATHVYPQIKVNAGFDAGIIGTQWYPFLMFWDGNPTAQCSTPGDRAVDYMAGLSQIVAHEYQHGITAFSFIDGGNNPGLGYVGWAAAVHEGLSDVFGCLFSDVWTWGPEISSAGLVFRNAAFPRDATSWENRPGPIPCGWGHHNKDHFADRVSIPAALNGEQYNNGTILAHAAFLMAAGGVHQRASRSPALIPVSALAGETVNGHDFSRAARIWYRALTTYLATYVKGITNRASLDEEMFRQIFYGCVSAAEDLYGTGSVEQQSTVLAFYAVGLHPVAASYGADMTCMPWAAAWRRSRPYLGGIYGGCPDWASVDLFVNNDGITSEWNALVNVLDSSGNPTHYENTVYCRVRNVGDLPAQNIVVSFSYAKVSPAAVTWLPVVDKNGVAQTLVLSSLNAGESSFPDSSQSAPPASGSVKWHIPPLTPGETIDHFCLRATLACADVNLFNNDVQSNIVYAAYTSGVPLKVRFHVTNPFKRTIRANLSVTAEVPSSWQARLTGESGDADLPPGAQVEREIVIDMPPGADARLVPPLDGVVRAELHGPVSGPCLGALSDTRLEGSKLTGRLAIELPSIGSVQGGFTGTVDLATGAFQGVVLAALQNAAIGEIQPTGVGLTGRLRPWRRVHVEQTVDGERVGGFSIQVQGATPGGLDAAAMPGTATRVPRG